MNLDEKISGFSYKMQESEPIHIPEPHTLSQEDFDTFLEKVEEYYQDAAILLWIMKGNSSHCMNHQR